MIFFPFVVELFTFCNSFIKLLFHKLCYELLELCGNTLDIFGHGLNKSSYTKFTDPVPFIFTTINERFYRFCKSISNLISTSSIIRFNELKSSTDEGVIKLLFFGFSFCLIFISDSSGTSIFYRVILNSIRTKLVCGTIWSFSLAVIGNFEFVSIASFNSYSSSAIHLKIMSNSLKIGIIVL